jgi:hypothetical protein
MKPEVIPTRPGDPCWTRASVEGNLSPVAQLSGARTDWFLATHSPIQCRSTSGETYADSVLFDRFFRSAAHEQLIVIKGPPGAGKSQLINWLRLRFEDALQQGEPRPSKSTTLRTVLIRRRSGSLKDALEQLVEQLPEYRRFLANVQDAITQISDDQARRKLSFAIALALSELKEKGLLDNDLQNLREVFQDVRLIETMCREGGTIDKNIQRLISESDVQERESLPAFSQDDFDFRGKRRGQVDTLMLDLLEEEEPLRIKAADSVNAVLRGALASVTGIKGQTLHEVFRGIRRAMRAASEDLALFVEDVSTMSILDEELVNALEPQGDPDLCRMLSVLGMTLPAYNRLQENKKDRITEAWEVQGDFGESGSLTDAGDTDRFVARYLNALRVGDKQTSALLQGRRTEGDVAHSACEGCDQREECFQRFSSVQIGDTRIGLFPLTAGAASRLLEGLDRRDGGRNPRVLLRHVLLPLLENFEPQGGKRHGSFGINVKPAVPSDSTSVSATILGGWSATDKGRLNYLTWYWTGQQSISSGRNLLEPMLSWFGIPAFGGSPAPLTPTPLALRDRPTGASPQPTPPRPDPGDVSKPLQDARDRLTGWMHQQKKLVRDADFRDLLLSVVKSSLDEENTRSPSSEVRAVATSRTPLKTSNIVIQDMDSRPSVTTKAKFIFNREQSTFDLLNALLDFKYLGRDSWSFEGGVTQQRVFAQWLRRERERLLGSLDTTTVRPAVAQRVAAAFLVIAYRFSKRTALPSDTADAVEALCSFQPAEPVTVTAAAGKLASDASTRVEKVRGFLLRHLSVPQGSASSINFIDSRVLQEAVSQYRSSVQLPEVESQTLLTDFPDVFNLLQSDWSRILVPLQEEQAELKERLGHLTSIMERWAIEAVDLKEGEDTLTASTRIFLESARKVEKSCTNAGHMLGNSDLQTKIRDLAPAKVQVLIACLGTAAKAVEGNPEGVLSLDVAPLLKLYTFIDAVHQAMLTLERSLALDNVVVITEADVEGAKDGAIMAVHQLEVCLNEIDPPAGG